MKQNIDLHIHSNYSDGDYCIEDLVEKLKEQGIETFSITDHDNIDGTSHVKSLNLEGLNYITGVEISSYINDYNIHVLGYDFNNNTVDMEILFKTIRQKRKERILDIVDHLELEHNIKLPEQGINDLLSKASSISKAHIVQMLYENGHGTDFREIYIKYLKEHQTKIKYQAPINDVIKVVKNANGLAILAHPKEVEDEYNIDINNIIGELIEKGIDGIEVYNSLHELKDIRRYLEIAKKYNLLISAGSDYHGIFIKPNARIGNVSQENIQVKQLTLVDRIYQRRNK